MSKRDDESSHSQKASILVRTDSIQVDKEMNKELCNLSQICIESVDVIESDWRVTLGCLGEAFLRQ